MNRTTPASAAFAALTLTLAGAHAAAQPSAQPAPAPISQPAADVPAPKVIVANYIKAIGGADALRAPTSRTDTGTVEMIGTTGEFVTQSAAPDKRVITIKLGEAGELIQGFDGTTGWDISPQGQRVLAGDELAYRARNSDFTRPLSLESKHDLRSLGVVERDGKKCYKVGATPAATPVAADKPTEIIFYFDVESGLLVGQTLTRPTPQGPMEVDTSYADYKKFGDVLIPTTTSSKVMGGIQTIKTTKVEFNAVAPTAFDLPATIKEKLKK